MRLYLGVIYANIGPHKVIAATAYSNIYTRPCIS